MNTSQRDAQIQAVCNTLRPLLPRTRQQLADLASKIVDAVQGCEFKTPMDSPLADWDLPPADASAVSES